MAINWGKVNEKLAKSKDDLKKFDTRTTKKYASGVTFPQTAAGGGKTSTGSSSPAPLKTGSSAQNVGRELAFARRTRADSGTIKKLQDQQNAYLAQQPKDTGVDFLKDVGWGIGYGSERIGADILGAIEGLTDFVGSTGSKALEYITSVGYSRPNDVSEFWRKQAESYLSTSPTETYKQSIEERYKPKDWQRAVGDVEGAVAAMLPSLVATYATGGGSAVAQLGSTGSKLLPTGANLGRTIMGVQAAGGGAQQAFQEGADIGEALTFGAASGALEAATESLVGGVPGLGKGAASELLEKVISNPLVRRSIDVAGEGAEEAISTIVTPYLQRAIYDPDAKNASLDEIAQNAVMGMAAAGVLQAGIELPTAFSNRFDITRQANSNLNNPEFVQRTTQEAVDQIDQDLSQQARTLPTVEAQEAAAQAVPLLERLRQQTNVLSNQQAEQVLSDQEAMETLQQSTGISISSQITNSSKRSAVKQAFSEYISGQSSAQQQPFTLPTVETINQETTQHSTLPNVQPSIAQTAQEVQTPTVSTETAAQRRQEAVSADYEVSPVKSNTESLDALAEKISNHLNSGKRKYGDWSVSISRDSQRDGATVTIYKKSGEKIRERVEGGKYFKKEELNTIAAEMIAEQEANFASDMAQEPEGPAMLPTFEPEYGPESSVGAARYGFDPYTNLQGKYGTLPEGEKPSRVVDVPARTSDKSKVSLTARTVMEAAATPDSALPDIAQLVVDGRLSYMPVSNNQRTVMAESKIKSVGYSDALANWRSDVRAGKSSADLVAMGAQLYNAAVNAGDAKAAMDILYDYTRLIRSGAQATQAARIMKTLTPAGTLYMIQKEVNNINEAQSSKKKRKVTSADNVPVEIWMQRVGENLADDLSRRIEAPKNQVQTVAQTILSDLRRYANETAPKRLQTGKTRTEMDRIMDLFQNKAAYNEAWAAAKDTLSDTFENDPDALAAFDDWLNQSLDYTKALTKELTKQSDIVIPEDLADAYLSAETEEARAQALDAIYQNVADQVPSTWKDKWNAWRYFAMLGNPRTHFRNIFGNVGFQPVRWTKDRLASVIEAGVSAASGGKLQRTKSFAYNPALYAAAWNDFKNVKDVLSGSKYDDVQSIINNNRTIFNKGLPTKALELLTGKTFDSGIMEGLRKGSSNLLGAEDMVFKRVTYADALSGYLAANGVTAEQLKSGSVDPALMSAARDYAGQEALKATYNDRNVVSDRVVQIARPLGMFGEAILPFKRTPANILVRGAEYSPLGLVKGIYDGIRRNKSGAQVIDEISAGLTGSGLLALGGLLAAAGVVSGGAGDDDKQAGFDQLTGAQTYALNLPGGGSVTLDWLAPEALPFFVGVQLVNTGGEEGFTPETILSSLSSISEPMLEMSMLQSLNDLIDNVSFAASNEKLQGLVWSSLVSYFTQALPTLGGQIERSYEDTRMSTYTDKNSLIPADAQYALGKASAKIPGWDFQQIPYIDEWGRTESNGPLALRTFNNFLNPAYTSQRNVTPLDEEIQRIYDETGEGGVIPNRAPKYLTIDGERIDLDAEQYVKYATERGQLSYEIGSDMIGKRAFSGLTDEHKAEVLSEVYNYADSIAKMSISSYTPPKWIQKVVSSGVDPATAILYHESDADTETKRRMLMNDNTLTAAEKSAIDKALFDDGMYIPKEMDVDYSSEETFTITQLSDAGQRKWEAAQRWGMPYEDYAKYYPICSASGKGMTKDVVIQNLIDAGMSRNDAYGFWNLIRNG